MIQRIQSVYFLVAALLILVVGTSVDLLHVEVLNKASKEHVANLNLSGFAMRGDLDVSATRLTENEIIDKISIQKNTTL